MPYWLLITIGVSLFLALLVSLSKRDWEYMLTSILFFIGIVMIVGVSMAGRTADDPHYSKRYTEDTPIYSLRTSDQVTGSFVLGSGTVGETTFYVYYTRDVDGAYSINKLDSASVKIYMDRTEGGTLTKVWGKINDENLHKNWGWEETIFSHYELHLPVGSLVQEYSVR